MTYCLAIAVDQGVVLAADSRTNAGVDYITAYSKMHLFQPAAGRVFMLLSAGNLATSQEVVYRLRRDLETPGAEVNLGTVSHLFEAAAYTGRVTRDVIDAHLPALQRSGVSGDASFILGGQISGQPHGIFLIYPQGNCIAASARTPFLQIGETKYGKPVLDRVSGAPMTLADAARVALVSLDATMRSNITVGPPFELAIIERDRFDVAHHLTLGPSDRFFRELQRGWQQALERALVRLPRFDWE